ncbi:damage-inducible protein CinA [Litorivita pollutaquae]|uniref:Damage-inducible protein CinA n=1 Tax=Litorivita pollutaquae TaxID=2200892 RepID=A0A2V4MNP1_9RHOB|nr:CinA family protein [Litorivita pollutaquae]PYC48345.1 damage-inducible protein CinA [Litorivita pollutaquae]
MIAEELANRLLEAAKARGAMVTTAESCTGGMLGAAITDIAGSSAVFERGFLTYTNAAKEEMLGVSAATLSAHGAVSEEVAREMAAGALARSHADLAVAITGIAGPGGSDNKPEGRVCFGLAQANAPLHAETTDFGPLGRSAVRQFSVQNALMLLIEALETPRA